MIFVQHVPTFIEGATSKTVEFDTLSQLLANPWIKGWAQDPDFFRFSLADRDTLMVENKNGTWWWVLGYIRNGDAKSLGLPTWVSK